MYRVKILLCFVIKLVIVNFLGWLYDEKVIKVNFGFKGFFLFWCI